MKISKSQVLAGAEGSHLQHPLELRLLNHFMDHRKTGFEDRRCPHGSLTSELSFLPGRVKDPEQKPGYVLD